MSRIKPRRKLSDLYAKGREVRFGEDGCVVYEEIRNRQADTKDRILIAVYDLNGTKLPLDEAEWKDSDDDVVIWLRPPNPHQREQALRDAQAERSRMVLKARRDLESPEHVNSEVFIDDMEFETLLEYVLGMDEATRRDEAQRNVLLKPDWKDFTELQDAMRQWDDAGQPDTDEWRPLVERDLQFGTEVDAETDRLRDASRESLKLLGLEELRKRGRERWVDRLGNQAFMVRFEREMLFYACRDFDNRDLLFFDSVEDMMAEDEYALDMLANVNSDYIKDSREAKNVQRVAPGSASSEPPVAPETSEASTPTTAIA